jgi:hypothetical protein
MFYKRYNNKQWLMGNPYILTCLNSALTIALYFHRIFGSVSIVSAISPVASHAPYLCSGIITHIHHLGIIYMLSITQLIERLTTELTFADVVSITPYAALADAKTIR